MRATKTKPKPTKWTQFMDMHSGGGLKEKYDYIYIEAPENEAEIIFYNRFGHNPNRVSCTCCGNDYSITEGESLERVTAYERGCRYDNEKRDYVEEPDARYSYKSYMTLEEYKNRASALFIYAKDIKPNERVGDVPTEGYVWM